MLTQNMGDLLLAIQQTTYAIDILCCPAAGSKKDVALRLRNASVYLLRLAPTLFLSNHIQELLDKMDPDNPRFDEESISLAFDKLFTEVTLKAV
jgi:hypothetical protein